MAVFAPGIAVLLSLQQLDIKVPSLQDLSAVFRVFTGLDSRRGLEPMR